MMDLRSAKGLKALAHIANKDTLFAFDYDGTLAPIVRDPHKALMSKTTEKLLKELSQKASVVIVTGRSTKDVKTKFKFNPGQFIGNHGIESGRAYQKKFKKARSVCKQWVNVFAAAELPQGLYVEDKKFSLSLHYRECKNHSATEKQLLKILSTIKPRPQAIKGKLILNVLPPGSPHKGDALLRVFRESRKKKLFFIGDDVTDEKVFELKHKALFSIHVGTNKKSAAQYFISRQTEINWVLRSLLKQL